MIYWDNFLTSEFQFVLVVYIIQASAFFPLAYRSFRGYVISLLVMILIPSIVVIGLVFLGAGRNGFSFPWAELFLASSAVHFLFFSVVLLFKRKREHWIKLFVSLLIVLFTYTQIYVENYMDEWKHKNMNRSIHYMVMDVPITNFQKDSKSNYSQSQALVRNVLNKASVPKCSMPSQNIWSVINDKYKNCKPFERWKKPNISTLRVKQDEFDELRKYVVQEPNITYKYEVDMYENRAVVVVHSDDRKSMRLVFYLSKTDRWKIDKILIRRAYSEKNIDIFGGTSDIQDIKFNVNLELLNEYKNEFDKAIDDFILAKNDYEIFKARIKYSLALRNMEAYGKWYEYLNYIEKRMQERAKALGAMEKLLKNKKRLRKIYTKTTFDTIKKIQNEILQELSQKHKKYVSTETLYQKFIKEYFNGIVKSKYACNQVLNNVFLQYEPLYIRALKGKYVYQRLLQPTPIANRLNSSHNDWNSKGGVMALESIFIYTNKYISRKKLKELFDDEKILQLIDTLKDIKIRDIRYNPQKHKEYCDFLETNRTDRRSKHEKNENHEINRHYKVVF